MVGGGDMAARSAARSAVWWWCWCGGLASVLVVVLVIGVRQTLQSVCRLVRRCRCGGLRACWCGAAVKSAGDRLDAPWCGAGLARLQGDDT